MEEFKKNTIEIIKKVREKKGYVNFIQIGAYDGISFSDLANLSLLSQDFGIFIEPNRLIFEKLKTNKSDFKSVNFLDYAIIPNESFYHDNFYLDNSGGQSTFVQGLFNNGVPQKGYEIEKVKTLTVEELLRNHVNFDIDVIFLDCEGYDHDLIKVLLNYQEPEVIYFESWNTSSLNNILGKNLFTTRDEIMLLLTNKGYILEFEPVEENVLSYKK